MSEVIRVGGEGEQPIVPNIPPRRSVMDSTGLPPAPRFVSTFTGPQPQVVRESVFTREHLSRLNSSLQNEQSAELQLVPAATDEELQAAYQSGQLEVLGAPEHGSTDVEGGIHIRRSRTTTEDIIVESVQSGGRIPTSVVHLLGAAPIGAQVPEQLTAPRRDTYIPDPSPTDEVIAYAPSSPSMPVAIPPMNVVSAPAQEESLGDAIFGQPAVSAQSEVRATAHNAKSKEIPHRFRRAAALILAPLLAGGLVISDWSNFNDGMHYVGKEVGLTTRGAASINFSTLKEAIHIFASGNTARKG